MTKKVAPPTNGAGKTSGKALARRSWDPIRPTSEDLIRRDAKVVQLVIEQALRHPDGRAARALRSFAANRSWADPPKQLAPKVYEWGLDLPAGRAAVCDGDGTNPAIPPHLGRMTKAGRRTELRSMLEGTLKLKSDPSENETWRDAVVVFDDWALAYINDPLWPEEAFDIVHRVPHLRFLASIYLALSVAVTPDRQVALRVFNDDSDRRSTAIDGLLADERLLRESLSRAWPLACQKSGCVGDVDWFMLRAAEALNENPNEATAATRMRALRERRRTKK